MFRSNVPSSRNGRAIWNYVPRNRKSNVSYDAWKYVYGRFVANLYFKLRKIVDYRYDNNVQWNDEKNFELFCRFIYNNSSKYISPYIDLDADFDDDTDDDTDDK
jgi:hypothetical protein